MVASFLQSVTKAGLGAGYYYSLGTAGYGRSQLAKSLGNLTMPQVSRAAAYSCNPDR